MNKHEVARILNEIAVLLELKGENPFKSRAYVAGARAVENLDEDLAALAAAGRLNEIVGIGGALAEKIGELVRTGRLPYYEALKESVHPGLRDLMEVPGLGAKKIKALHEALGVGSLEDLRQACESGRVAGLRGFGEKTQVKILAGIRNREAYGKRHLWWEAQAIAQPIVEGLRLLRGVSRAETAGSLRRGLETVGDLDFVAASADPAPVMDWFCSLPAAAEVTARGETKASLRFTSGTQADLRIVPEEQFAFALNYFTGGKEHNIQMRQRALQLGWSLSEWGLSPARPEEAAPPGDPAQIRREEDLYRFLGLDYIPPELREGMGEIASAERGALPALVEEKDIRGVFHNHTTASDGHCTLSEMAEAVQAYGWEYLGIADHSKASFQANGLDEQRLERQIREIERLNQSGRFSLHLFSGVECDILPDGSLDIDETVLRQLDFVVVSIHSAFAQSEETMTRRILRAVEHPCTTMLAHPTGRLLLSRPGYQVDLEKVIDAAIAHQVIIEINANPRRLDMDWRFWRRAADKGLLCSINPDAHSREGLAHVRAGVMAARKGGLGAAQILNTWPLDEVRRWLKDGATRRATRRD